MCPSHVLAAKESWGNIERQSEGTGARAYGRSCMMKHTQCFMCISRSYAQQENSWETKTAVLRSWIACPFGRIAFVRYCGKRLFIASELRICRRKGPMSLSSIALFLRSHTQSNIQLACEANEGGCLFERSRKTVRSQSRRAVHTTGNLLAFTV